MFDNFTTVIFIIIAIVVFVGRTMAEARKQKNAPPRKTGEAAPHEEEFKSSGERIGPVHFEIKEEEDRKISAVQHAQQHSKKPAPVKAKTPGVSGPGFSGQGISDFGFAGSDLFKSQTAVPDRSYAASSVAKPAAPGHAAAQGQGGLHINLGKLSALQQAVVMAEILGPPKGLG